VSLGTYNIGTHCDPGCVSLGTYNVNTSGYMEGLDFRISPWEDKSGWVRKGR